MGVWIFIFLFYLLWDGWIYEWKECGYLGLNQHFDFEIFDMTWDIVNDEIVYYSTNNLHNIIYLCFFQFFVGWLSLVTGNEKLKQGTMALLAFPVMAAAATLNPSDHVYIVQIIYDIVHISGIYLGVYLFSKNNINLKKATPIIMSTWVIFIITRFLFAKWPFWENPTGYFSVNQMNNMPFYAYGFEYVIVIFIAYTLNTIIYILNKQFSSRTMKTLIPIMSYVALCAIFLAVGLITFTELNMGTCP